MDTTESIAQDGALIPPQDLDVVKLRHPGRWVASVIILGLAVLTARSMIENENFQWSVVSTYMTAGSVLRGVWTTVLLTVICMAIGIVLGVVVAVMRLSANPVVRTAAFGYVSFFRGTPVLVQLLFWFNLAALYPVISFGLPGVNLDANELITPFIAAILGLGINEGAYMSEIVRAGILSVDHGQGEAAEALGITRVTALRRIILPQAMRVIIPPTANEAVGMLKSTSLVSVIAVSELLYSVQVIYSRTFETIPLLIVASVWYLIVTSVLAVGQYYLERRFARGNRANLPLTPLQQVKRALRIHPSTRSRGDKL